MDALGRRAHSCGPIAQSRHDARKPSGPFQQSPEIEPPQLSHRRSSDASRRTLSWGQQKWIEGPGRNLVESTEKERQGFEKKRGFHWLERGTRGSSLAADRRRDQCIPSHTVFQRRLILPAKRQGFPSGRTGVWCPGFHAGDPQHLDRVARATDIGATIWDGRGHRQS